jgi:acetate---CoA ligase (ADP-forming)
MLLLLPLSSKVYFENQNMEDNLEKAFFSPTGIAVIGASRDPSKLGYALARNLVESGYPGSLYFINPHGGTLFDRPIYATVADIPDPVDLAVVLIPAPLIPHTLRACAERGIHSVVIVAGGFREIGPEGKAIEDECLAVARANGMRLIGPNCVGLIDTHLPFNATFLAQPGPEAGDLALLSQSGAICAAVIDWARGQGIGFSRMVSLGNQADLNETDLLVPTAADPHTKVITLYLEGIGNGKRFLEIVPQVSRHKPIVALKVGRSEGGQQAVASHTGSLAGVDHVFDAAFNRCGVIRAKTSEDLFDWARALGWCPAPKGNATAILTNAGGPGVMAADALEEQGLYLATLSLSTTRELRSILPAAASINNPIDLIASATPEQYATSLNLLLKDSKVDNILLILVPPPLFDSASMFAPMIPLIKSGSKPVVVVLMGDLHIHGALQLLRKAKIPDYRFPERAAAALGAIVRRNTFLQRIDDPRPEFPDVNKNIVKKMLAHVSSEGEWISFELIDKIFSAYGIPILPQYLATSPEEAVSAARSLHLGENGHAVAIKIASQDIPHKSDVGGVILNIRDVDSLLEGYSTVQQRVKIARPDATVHGVHIQPMIPPGQELILGAVQDAQFGPLVMFGSGGVEVEGLNDVAFGLAPLTEAEAEQMIDSTWAGKKIKGYRNLLPVDRGKIRELILRLGRLAADFPELNEIEINPLRALPDKLYALDVRIRFKKPVR